MTPAARIAAAIELLSQIEEGIAAGGLPADRIIQSYFRERRYAGSKDRRTIATLIYDLLRSRELVHWTAEYVGLETLPRSYIFVWLYLSGNDYKDLIADEHPYGPEPATPEELQKLFAVAGIDQEKAPEQVTLNIPVWAFGGMVKRFGADLSLHANALNKEAGVTLRSNLLKLSAKSSKNTLTKDINNFEKTQFSMLGYSSVERVNITQTKSFKEGLLEIQDEAAQIASLLVNAVSDEMVIDLCAGAGGKTLLMAVTMANKGDIHAFDIVGRRLEELSKRMKRAGAKNIKVHTLSDDVSEREKALGKYVEKADKVVLDVPCTGSGTWRRGPDLRWRYNEETLSELNKTQQTLLFEGAKLTKVGGKLFYMTCSVLPAENEDIVQTFLDRKTGWKLLDYKENWVSDYLSKDVPESDALVQKCLQLTPYSHGTDGFFIAIFERTA